MNVARQSALLSEMHRDRASGKIECLFHSSLLFQPAQKIWPRLLQQRTFSGVTICRTEAGQGLFVFGYKLILTAELTLISDRYHHSSAFPI